jgi:SPP1 gp7 family putative phage head morphogenesis protein
MTKRFRLIKRIVRYAIEVADVFGLREPQIPTPQVLQLDPWNFQDAVRLVRERMFAFPTSAGKIDAFSNWLDEINGRTLQMGRTVSPPTRIEGWSRRWDNRYIDHGYQRGIRRARQELIKAGRNIPTFAPTRELIGDPMDQGAIRMAMNQPIHTEQVGNLFIRNFAALRNITSAMDATISRELADGLAAGRGPREIARRLSKQIDNFTNRARTLARTELIRSHHVANITEYKAWEVAEVKVKAEWATAGFKVCPICATLEEESKKEPFTLDEIYGMIPAHPNCRCVAIPILQKPKKGEPTVPPKNDPTRWEKSGTIKEARQQMKDRFRIGNPIARVGGHGGFPSAEDALLVLNEAGAEMARTVAKYPHLGEGIRRGKQLGRLAFHYEEYSTVITREAPSRAAGFFRHYGVGGKPEIHVLTQRHQLTSLRQGRMVHQLNIGSNNFLVGGDWYDTIRHEWGHYFHLRSRGFAGYSRWNKLYENLNPFAKKPSMRFDWGKRISNYSSTNMKEGFAESFSAYTHPKYGQAGYPRLPRRVEVYFDKIMKAEAGVSIEGVAGEIPMCGLGALMVVLLGKACLTPRDVERVNRAKRTYKPATRRVQQIAARNERKLASLVDGEALGDNEPFDVLLGPKSNPSDMIELKPIVRGKNNKIKMHTVVFDERTGTIYYRKGVGSFRLSSMRQITQAELEALF